MIKMHRWLLPCLALPLVAAHRAPPASGSETILYNFTGGTDGAEPRGTMIVDRNGTLYGTTYRGGLMSGCAAVGCGTVFALMPPTGSGTAWTQAVLYAFSGGFDGEKPTSALVFDANGNLYGTTQHGGGAGCGGFGCGTVFMLSPPTSGGTVWTETILHRFSGPDGAFPMAELAFDAIGNLVGTTSQGGTGNFGTVFRLDAPVNNNKTWNEELLYSFTGLSDGGTPTGPVTVDSSGNLYGTATYGGTAGAGTVFELSPPMTQGGAWAQAVLYSMPGGANGGYPRGALSFDSAGNLYGTATNIAYSLSPPAGGTGNWTENTLYNFIRNADANIPFAGLALVAYPQELALYGTGGFGGSSRVGAVFKISTPTTGSPSWTEALTYIFNGGPTDGSNPYGGLLFSKGTLYGTTTFGGTSGASCDVGCGTVFAVTP